MSNRASAGTVAGPSIEQMIDGLLSPDGLAAASGGDIKRPSPKGKGKAASAGAASSSSSSARKRKVDVDVVEPPRHPAALDDDAALTSPHADKLEHREVISIFKMALAVTAGGEDPGHVTAVLTRMAPAWWDSLVGNAATNADVCVWREDVDAFCVLLLKTGIMLSVKGRAEVGAGCRFHAFPADSFVRCFCSVSGCATPKLDVATGLLECELPPFDAYSLLQSAC